MRKLIFNGGNVDEDKGCKHHLKNVFCENAKGEGIHGNSRTKNRTR